MNKITLTIVLTFLVLLFSVNAVAQSTACEVELSANRNITIQKVSSKGGFFNLTITNKGVSNDVFILTSNNNNSCFNVDGTNNSKNVVLNYSFLNSDKNPINEISLNEGESFNFLVSVKTPSGTNLNNWSCVEIVASSKNCENYSNSITLRSFVIDPKEG